MTERHVHENQMTNSHILVQNFDYFEPVSLEEAIGRLKKCGIGARVVAGGTHLLVLMKMERETPTALVSLDKIPGLDAVEYLRDDDTLAIGARATIRSLYEHPLVQAVYPALASACASFGSTQIQMMGTIGGNVCNGSPASDTIPALLIYGAVLEVVGPQGARRIPIAEFYRGPGKTVLEPNEILRAIFLPRPPEGSISQFVKVSRVAADLAKASLAVLLVRDSEQIVECRAAMGSVAPIPLTLTHTQALLSGKTYTPELLAQAGRAAASEISPIDDIRSTAWYRKQIASVMFRDTFCMLWEQAASSQPRPFPSLPSNGHKTLPAVHNLIGPERKEVEYTLNGRKMRLWVAANELLLNVLRERLELTGAKYGCGVGECGACSVLIDGKPALSCLTLAVSAAGKEITTIEGLQRNDGEADPVQQAFIDEAAFQCGYCTPGFLITARSLLNEIPQPSEEEVREYLKGNRCRCTGYASIVRAVLKAAESEN